MTTKLQTVEAAKPDVAVSPVSQTGACADFVSFCKEQYLKARAAETFVRVLHNKSYEAEIAQIRHAMTPEVDLMFAPIEKALREGVNCREIMAKLVKALEAPKK